MGRFEDLIEQAKAGEEGALDALEAEFSGSALREKAEKAESYEKELSELRPLQRKARFEDLTSKLDEGLRDLLSYEDVGDMEPNALTLESLQDLATTKKEAREATRLAAAQDAGFDSVEEYETALETVKRQSAERKTGMEQVGGSVVSSGGDAGGIEPTAFDVGKTAFDEAKKAGATNDIAQARFIDALLASQTGGVSEE